jgi:hypothetical protein
MKRGLPFWALLVGTCVPLQALAQDSDPQNKTDEEPQISLGLAPGTPQVGTLPGGVTPAYGQRAGDESQWRFDFHGFLSMPLRAGINKRAGTATKDQYSWVLHAPPVVPDYLGSFNYTGVVPQPYVQLNFSYGNSVVTGNIIVLSHTSSTAAAAYDPPAQTGISDTYLTFNLPDLAKNSHVQINVGAFTNRYGIMGQYDEGRYGTPLIARTRGAGETISVKHAFRDVVFALEQGISGQLDKAPNGMITDGWNGFADPNVGSGLVHHLHAGFGYRGIATLGAHYLFAWTQDERASQGLTPDGKIGVLGADLRLTMGRFGHFYVGASHTDARDARSVGRVIEVLNTPGGPGLMREYLGPNSGGTGKLLTIGAQYDLSLASVLYYPLVFKGDAPDIILSVFGIQTSVSSKEAAYDGVTKRKFGGEAAYSLLPWLAVSVRADRVMPNGHDSDQSFSILSPRIIFRTKWQSHDQVVLQYSRWFYGSGVVVRDGYPPTDNRLLNPDRDMVSLTASMWW